MSRTLAAPAYPDPIETDKIIGARLRARRILLSRSQSDLAEQCRLSPQQIHKYETGQSRMTGGRLVQLSEILEVPIAYFFDGLRSHQVFSEGLVKLLGDPNNTEALLIFSRLPEQTRSGIINMLRAVEADHQPSRSEPELVIAKVRSIGR